MDCRWIIFIFFLLVLFYLYLRMLWKYLSRIDRLFKRTFKPGYWKELFLTENIIVLKDKKLWDQTSDNSFGWPSATGAKEAL